MENKYNCDAYDSGYCYCLGRPLTDEENDMCEDYCCAYNIESNEVKDMNERYYWEKEDETLVPVHELTDYHICNIVMKFGKDCLRKIGHSVIADKFESLNKEYKFFEKVM